MNKKRVNLIIAVLLIVGVGLIFSKNASKLKPESSIADNAIQEINEVKGHPLMIEQMRKASYPGSEITIEDELTVGSNYKRYLASYLSDGLKIHGLLTIPTATAPAGGFAAIVFNHGYIPPEEYRTTERYVAYLDGFARSGYVVFKPDYRGHGSSEGNPEGAYYSPAYTRDVMNAVSSLKNYKGVNPDKIGMWGHSMGGHITLRSMVISGDVKAGVIWAGVVASYEDMANKWRRRAVFRPSNRENTARRPSRSELVAEFGTFEANPSFWQAISPISFVDDISGPVQIHHGTNDESVPWEFSESLKNALESAGKEVEYYTYEGADHNLSGASFAPAMERSIDFFDKHLK